MKLFFLILIFSLFFGCSDESNFQAGVAKKVSLSSNNDKDDDNEEVDEEEAADEPSEIAGAFLYCAVWDDDMKVRSKAANNEDIDIACGLYQLDEGRPYKASLNGTSMAWTILEGEQETPARFAQLPASHEFHTIVSVAPAQTGGSIVFKARDEEGAGHYRVKDIASIETMGADKPGYTVALDLASSGTNILGNAGKIECGAQCDTDFSQFQNVVQETADANAKQQSQKSNASRTQKNNGTQRYSQSSKNKPITSKSYGSNGGSKGGSGKGSDGAPPKGVSPDLGKGAAKSNHSSGGHRGGRSGGRSGGSGGAGSSGGGSAGSGGGGGSGSGK
jgi:hypothetical protein